MLEDLDCTFFCAVRCLVLNLIESSPRSGISLTANISNLAAGANLGHHTRCQFCFQMPLAADRNPAHFCDRSCSCRISQPSHFVLACSRVAAERGWHLRFCSWPRGRTRTGRSFQKKTSPIRRMVQMMAARSRHLHRRASSLRQAPQLPLGRTSVLTKMRIRSCEICMRPCSPAAA